VAVLLALALQQTGQGSLQEGTYGDINKQLLVIANEKKCNSMAEEYWKAAALSQESSIGEVVANT